MTYHTLDHHVKATTHSEFEGKDPSHYQLESLGQSKAQKSIEARLRRSIQKRLINSSVKDLPFRFHPALQLEFLHSLAHRLPFFEYEI